MDQLARTRLQPTDLLLGEQKGRLQPLFQFERLLPSTHTAIMRDVGRGVIPVTIGIGSWGSRPSEEWTGQAPATLQYGIPVSVIEHGGMDICVAGCPRELIHLTGDKVMDSKSFAPKFAPIGEFVKAALEEMRVGKGEDLNPGFPTWSRSEWTKYLKDLWQTWDLRIVRITAEKGPGGTKLKFAVSANPGSRIASTIPRILVADANSIIDPETKQLVNFEGVAASTSGMFDATLISSEVERLQPAPDALLISIEPDHSTPKSTTKSAAASSVVIDAVAKLVQ